VFDGFFAASRNPERDSFGVMSASIADQKWQWFLLKNNKIDPSQPDFKDKATVAGFIGSNMLYWLKQNGFNIASKTVNTEGLFNMLMRGRVDAVIANNYVMGQILTLNEAVERVKIVTIKSKPLGVYFSNFYIDENPLFIEKFNHNIAVCRHE
jgi:polar amino acid transport system substrate-binding protein